MHVLVACELSGVVRESFRKRGHDAWSCDLKPADDGSRFHIQGDCFDAIRSRQWDRNAWDLVIAHPPCTALSVSGNRWYAGTPERIKAFHFVEAMVDRMTKYSVKWALENPVGVLSTLWRKPDQYIQPWQFGHGETKKTGLWLHGLPKLRPTNVVEGREQRIWKMGPSPERQKMRSQTFQGIADAMAEQWG